jgi:hypothetical protein
MSIKNTFRKVAELLVELPPEQIESVPEVAPTRSVKEIVESSEGPNLSEITAPEEKVQSAVDNNGVVNFVTVYQSAGLPISPFTAEQALDVIASLPSNLPIEIRRATVQATLTAMGKALGVNTETVVADASRKLAALSAYEDALSLKSGKYVGGLQLEIESHQRRIDELNNEIAATHNLLKNAVESCTKEADRLDDVLEFFTLDVGVSRNAV